MTHHGDIDHRALLYLQRAGVPLLPACRGVNEIFSAQICWKFPFLRGILFHVRRFLIRPYFRLKLLLGTAPPPSPVLPASHKWLILELPKSLALLKSARPPSGIKERHECRPLSPPS